MRKETDGAWKKYYQLHRAGTHTEARQYLTSFLLTHGTVRSTIAEVIAPTLVEIGTAWHNGALDIADEHRISFRVRGDIYALDALLPAPTADTPQVLLACVPGENHEIALGLVALSAHEAGWDPLILGINTPLEEVLRTVRAFPRVRALGLTKIYHRAHDATTYVQALARAPILRHTPILLGGSGWNAQERSACARFRNVTFCSDTDAFTAKLPKQRKCTF
jgi:methanogenic corrinoid protein MtbC1